MNSSTIRLFADDCLIYKEIHSQQDTEDLQIYLNALQTWERRWLSSVTAMLHIGWDTLHGRAKSRLAMQFRIAHNLVDIPAADHLQTCNSRKGNAAKLSVCHMHGLWPSYRHSFFPDVTRMWNALPYDMVTSSSVSGRTSCLFFSSRLRWQTA